VIDDPLLDRLPIIIGVTGHRDLDLRPEYESALRARVDSIFAKLAREFPATPLLLLTPLAEGADRLVAEVARSRGIPYRVPLPMPIAEYREDFMTAESLAAFDTLVEGAETLPYVIARGSTEESGQSEASERRAESYALVGAHIVRSSHVFIALWNGLPSEATGGTAQIVRFRVLGVPQRYLPKRSVVDEPEVGPVHHVYAARLSEPLVSRPVGTYSLRIRSESKTASGFDAIDERPGESADPFALLYARIEAFNRDRSNVPGDSKATEPMSATSRLMATAERLASYYQRKSRVALTRLFVATAIAGLMFESYAHPAPQWNLLIVPYVVALGFAVASYVRANRGRWQDRAQDYRALEIGLRVQHVWDAVGLGESVADYYIARQRTELDWIPKAIGAAHTLDLRLPFDEQRGIAAVRTFLTEQYTYFAGAPGRRGATARDEARSRRFEALRSWAFRAGFFASALLVLFALTDSIWPAFYGGPEREDLWHGGLIFCIGCAAISAALFNDYLERRGFEEHARRYELMTGMYRRALVALDDSDRSPLETARVVIAEVGHEALAENGDWVLMHRALPIELLQIG
jgi:hypothetical protein